DTAEVALASGVFGRVALAADRAPSGDVPAGLEVRLDRADASEGAFRFGPAFVALAEELRPGGVAYVGAGSGPLLRAADLEALVAPLVAGRGAEDAAGVVVTNN